jgi:hypothetical protein
MRAIIQSIMNETMKRTSKNSFVFAERELLGERLLSTMF